jgi:hypothetical protein
LGIRDCQNKKGSKFSRNTSFGTARLIRFDFRWKHIRTTERNPRHSYGECTFPKAQYLYKGTIEAFKKDNIIPLEYD